MSIKAKYVNGVFEPLEEFDDIEPDQIYRVFSEEELTRLLEDLGWLKAAEKSFDFWKNEEDAFYDNL